MEDLKKLTYSEAINLIGIVHIYPGGVEYIAEEKYDEGKFDFATKTFDKTYWKNNGMDKEEIKYMSQVYREANKNLGKWKKGIRKIIKMANKGPGAINLMASAYTGNGPTNPREYFMTLYRLISGDDIILLGSNEASPIITHYVDGTADYYMENN